LNKVGQWVQKIRLLKGGQKKVLFNLSNCTWFNNWNEDYFIPNGIGAIMGVGSFKPFITTPIFQNDYDFFGVLEIIGINYFLF
jgi:hypothetical protein